MNTRIFCITAMGALLLGACATPSSRIEDKQDVYNRYPPEVRSRIAAGEVDIGFTQEQAKLALGEPSRKYSRTTERGASEVWAYSKAGVGVSVGLGVGGGLGGGFGGGVGIASGAADNEPTDKLRVVFENGRVSSIEQAVK